jgi:hypothetical protein
MKVDVVTESDDQFKIKVKKFGEVFVAKDEDRVAIGSTEEAAVEGVVEMQESAKKAKQAVPLENKKGLGWFDGTSWGNN